MMVNGARCAPLTIIDGFKMLTRRERDALAEWTAYDGARYRGTPCTGTTLVVC